jgi:hypothetical protein
MSHFCGPTCKEHYRSPLEEEIAREISCLVGQLTPPKSRALITTVGNYVDVRLVCSGAAHITCYYCCLEPGHKGRCYSSNKNVNFTPESY